MKQLNTQEYFEILSELDSRHGVFYHLWDMGSPVFSEQLLTAGVVLDEHGECMNFLINEEFWSSLNLEQKIFVLCHECLHVVLNHGHRLFKNANDKQEFKMMNYATDVVINHTLVKKFSFDRTVIDPENKYCWVDTVFKEHPEKDEIPDDKSSEFYYNKIQEFYEENGKMPSGGSGNEPETVDEHSTFIPENSTESQDDMSDFLKELNDRLTDDEMDFIEDLLESNKDLDDKFNESKDCGMDSGSSPGNIFRQVEIKKVQKKKKWETVIKKWANQFLKQKDRDEVQWARMNRRFQIVGNSGMFLPSEMEVEDVTVGKNRVEVWFFQDTSGSCSGYSQRFFDAARSLPKEKFDIKMHCFDTRVYETSVESGALYGFGGTFFSPIEDYIQKDIKKRNVAYPRAVFVITDGYGNRVNPEKPQNWYWFLTPNGGKHYIPKKSHVFDLSDFE